MDINNRVHRSALQLTTLIVFFGAWAAAASVSVIPNPIAVAAALSESLSRGDLITATSDALMVIITGFFLAAVVGVGLGLLMGMSPIAEGFFDPYVDGLYVTPLSAMVPALVLWLGTGFNVRLTVVFLFSIFPIIINTLHGVKDAPEELVAAVRSFGANQRFLIRHVILPHEVPYIIAGMRLGIGRAVKGLVVAELLISVTGIGAIITQATASLDMPLVFAVITVLMVLGIVLTGAVQLVERRLVHWDTADV